jgi:acetyltransferase-like isoleucine patch superfamily enzyme
MSPRAALVRALRCGAHLWRLAWAKALTGNARIPWSTRLGPGVELRVTDGGRLVLGEGVDLGANTLVVVRGGTLEIAAGAFVGRGCVLAARERIEIGAKAQLAEYVTVRDQDHDLDAGAADWDAAGYATTPVRIGARAWLGAKASVLRGGDVGDDAVVGAHALVRGPIPAGAVAVGVPARVVRQRGGADGD